MLAAYYYELAACFNFFVPETRTKNKNKIGDRKSMRLSNSDFWVGQNGPKMNCPKMSNISWSSKTGYNGSNKALFEAISKLDKQDSQKGCGQSLYCYELH